MISKIVTSSSSTLFNHQMLDILKEASASTNTPQIYYSTYFNNEEGLPVYTALVIWRK